MKHTIAPLYPPPLSPVLFPSNQPAVLISFPPLRIHTLEMSKQPHVDTSYLFFKADLQTSSQRLNLSASNAAVAELKPDCCIDDVIHHEVKEIGTHM